MSAAYVISQVEVTDPKAYERYKAETPAVVAAFGGEFVVRGGRVEVLEGEPPMGRVIVTKFPSMEKALAFYHSDKHADLLKFRLASTECRRFIVEGVD